MNEMSNGTRYTLDAVAGVAAFASLAKILPPTCGRCGRNLERRKLGEQICNCHGG